MMATYPRIREDYKNTKKRSKMPNDESSRFELTVCYQCQRDGVLEPEFLNDSFTRPTAHISLALQTVKSSPTFIAVSKMVNGAISIPTSGDKVPVRHRRDLLQKYPERSELVSIVVPHGRDLPAIACPYLSLGFL